jgi:hypothetical protein
LGAPRSKANGNQKGSREIPPGHSGAVAPVLADVPYLPPWSKVKAVPKDIGRRIAHCGSDDRFQRVLERTETQETRILAKPPKIGPKTAKSRKKHPRWTRKPRKSGKNPWRREESKAIDFTHDTKKYGNPLQSWPTQSKCYWMLYVLSKEADVKEASTGQIVETFNKHFKQAKPLRPSNVSRDLGKDKVKKMAVVAQDTSKPNQPWFLTDEGIKLAEQLVTETTSLS